jgi:PEGA domain
MRTATPFLRALAATLLLASTTAAQESPSARQASAHFQRGVALYGEADYRAALVEFRRAYAIAPNAGVLYNVAETQFQLQDYAGALATFERFAAESAPGDAHRAEVETNLDVLRARVGHIAIATVPGGADVTVDDQPAGRTPLDRAVLVSIGHRKVVATLAGRPPVTRYVDVAAGDNLTVTLAMPAPDVAPATAAHAMPLTTPPDAPPPSHTGATWRTVGWGATGLLAAGAVTFGVVASRESSVLTTERNTYPASGATLDHDASLTRTYSIVSDVFTGTAILVGGVTALSTLLSRSSTPTRGGDTAPRLVLGPGSARLEGAF